MTDSAKKMSDSLVHCIQRKNRKQICNTIHEKDKTRTNAERRKENDYCDYLDINVVTC